MLNSRTVNSSKIRSILFYLRFAKRVFRESCALAILELLPLLFIEHDRDRRGSAEAASDAENTSRVPARVMNCDRNCGVRSRDRREIDVAPTKLQRRAVSRARSRRIIDPLSEIMAR